MAFDKKTWANNQAGGTPLDASGLNDLEARIDDEFDNLNNKTVIEGSNFLGKWLKYPDGTLIQYRTTTPISLNISLAWGSLYVGTDNTQWDFPIPFYEVPDVVNLTVIVRNNVSVMPANYIDTVITKDYIKGVSFARPTTSSSATPILHIVAIGRWK